jgi:CyaY protein
MNENDFNELAEKTLGQVMAAFDASGVDCEPELKAGGVLEVEFENGTKIIVNKHGAAQEIWVAAKSGGFHFKNNNGQWVDTRSGEELFQSLSKLATQQAGETIELKAGS